MDYLLFMIITINIFGFYIIGRIEGQKIGYEKCKKEIQKRICEITENDVEFYEIGEQ